MRKILILFIIGFTFESCGVKMGVTMPMGDGVYTLTWNGRSGYVALGKIKRKVYDEAKIYANDKNAIVEVISVNEVKTGFGVWPQIDLTFRLVDGTEKLANPENLNVTTTRFTSSANGKRTSRQTIIKQDISEKENDKYEKLLKLGSLKKEGILTEQEFLTEKNKILNSVNKDSSTKKNDKYGKLLKLDNLKKQGIITEKEFTKEKNKILTENI